MGQKVNPFAFRLGSYASHKATWVAIKKTDYATMLGEDIAVRKYLAKTLADAAISDVTIARVHKGLDVTLCSARPGVVLGRQGSRIEELKSHIKGLLKNHGADYSVKITLSEVKRPEIDATLVGQNIASQLERRVMFRRAMKRSVQSAMRFGATGIKVQVSGRLNGAEIARTEWVKEGSIPLHTLRSNIDYSESSALTTYGIIGIKVWINKPDVADSKNTSKSKPINSRGD